MSERYIIETIERIRREMRNSNNAFKLDFYNDAYRIGPAMASILDDHASKYSVREKMISDYRSEYGYPNEVLCAVDGKDYNGLTAKTIASSVEREMRKRKSASEAHAIGNDFRGRKFSTSGDETITQLMDNGELFVIRVKDNLIKSHYVAGPIALAKMRKVFDDSESGIKFYEDHASTIKSGIDSLIRRMEPLKKVRVPSHIRFDHHGHDIGCEFENIDWDRVNEKHYDYIRKQLEDVGFFSKGLHDEDDVGDKPK